MINATPSQIKDAIKYVMETHLSPVGPKPLKVVFRGFPRGIAGRFPFGSNYLVGGRMGNSTMGRTRVQTSAAAAPVGYDYERFNLFIGVGAMNSTADLDALEEQAVEWVEPVYRVLSQHSHLNNTVSESYMDDDYVLLPITVDNQLIYGLTVPLTVKTRRMRINT